MQQELETFRGTIGVEETILLSQLSLAQLACHRELEGVEQTIWYDMQARGEESKKNKGDNQ